MVERLQQPDAPAAEAEAPEEEFTCSHCPIVFTGPDAWYELGAHEGEHIEGEAL